MCTYLRGVFKDVHIYEGCFSIMCIYVKGILNHVPLYEGVFLNVFDDVHLHEVLSLLMRTAPRRAPHPLRRPRRAPSALFSLFLPATL